jgi:hypothetical protein
MTKAGVRFVPAKPNSGDSYTEVAIGVPTPCVQYKQPFADINYHPTTASTCVYFYAVGSWIPECTTGYNVK